MEYAAFGFATLTWWTYLILLVVVFTAVYGSWVLFSWQERREEKRRGPFPCFHHMGTRTDGLELWCWQQDGHDGPHFNPWVEQDTSTAPAYDAYCLRLGCTLGRHHDGPCNAYSAAPAESEHLDDNYHW